MPAQRLPERIEPFRLAETGRAMAGQVALAALPRLRSLLVCVDERSAEVELTFGIDEGGTRYLKGRLRAEVELVCQRCLEVMTHLIDTEICLGLIEAEAAAELLAAPYDPLVVPAGGMYLRDIIEDELILALPIVPRHAAQACPAAGREEEAAATDGGPELKTNPFAVLGELKKRH